LAAGARVVPGLAFPGGWPGAIASGAGELGAELIEGSAPDITRIGTEAGIGAIPFSKWTKVAGELPALRAGIRGAGITGSSEALRQAIDNEPGFDPKRILGNTLLGGGISGVLAKLFGVRGVEEAVPSPITSSYTGRINKKDILPIGVNPAGATAAEAVPTILNQPPSLPKQALPTEFYQFLNEAQGQRVAQATLPFDVAEEAATSGGRQPYTGYVPDASTPARFKADQKAAAAAKVALAKLEEEEAAATQIAKARKNFGEPTETVSESFSAPIPGGKERLTRRFAPEGEAGAEGGGRPGTFKGGLPTEGPARQVFDQLLASGMDEIEALQRTISGNLPRGFTLPSSVSAAPGVPVRSKVAELLGVSPQPEQQAVEAIEQGNRVPKFGSAFPEQKIGEAPAEYDYDTAYKYFLREVGDPEEARRLADEREIPIGLNQAVQGWRRPVNAPVMPPGRGVAQAVSQNAPEGAQVAPGATNAPPWVQEQLSIVDRLKKLATEESGEINPELAMQLGSAAAGGVVGAATDPFDDPLLSGVAGAGLGLAGQQAVRNPQDLKDLLKMVPQAYRANLLTSTSLPANAIVGPYGSVFSGALESMLSGDPRGKTLMKSLNPVKFSKDWWAAREEAKDLIAHGELGRAEEIAFDPSNPIKGVLAAPGVAMTAGDVAARKLAEGANYSPAESKIMTMTSEPESPTLHRLSHAVDSSDLFGWLGQMAFPFRRTPMNVAEQGMRRIPGVGFVAQAMRENPDDLRTQLAQQGLGAAYGLGGAALGSQLDPETAKYVRPYVTNFAGRYSLPAGLGFAAGQAIERGGSPTDILGQTRTIEDIFPLPTTDPLVEAGKLISGQGGAPRGSYPILLRQLFGEPTTQTTSPTRPLGSLRRTP
jgi:hypothetical protein